MTEAPMTTAPSVPEPWVGWRDGQVVARYPDRRTADAALYRREVQTISPEPRPKADQ